MAQGNKNQALTLTAGILFLFSFIIMLVASAWRLFVGIAVAFAVLLVVAMAQACASSCGGSPEPPGPGWSYGVLVGMIMFFALGTVLSSIVYFVGAIESLLWHRAPEQHHRGLLIMGALGVIFTALGFVATTVIPLITLGWFDFSILLPIPPILASILLLIAGVLTRPKAGSKPAPTGAAETA